MQVYEAMIVLIIDSNVCEVILMKRKLITIIITACLIMSMSAYAAMATSHTVHFSVSSATKKATVSNGTGSSMTLSSKATLQSGTGGVWVQVRNAKGTSTVASKLFPYQDQSVGPLYSTIGSGVTRTIYVMPNTAGQTVTGYLHCEY